MAVRMHGGGGEKIDHWVLRVTRDFKGERKCVYLFIFFLEGDKWMRNEKVGR